MIEVCRFIEHRNDLCLRFIDSFNVCATVVIDLPEDPSEGCDLQGSFADDWNVPIGPFCSLSSGFRQYLILTFFT